MSSIPSNSIVLSDVMLGVDLENPHCADHTLYVSNAVVTDHANSEHCGQPNTYQDGTISLYEEVCMSR